MIDHQPKPIEVVEVQPVDYTFSQAYAGALKGAVTGFLAPLALRALARNFGVDMGYWKAVRTTWALGFVARSVLPGGFKFPPARGKSIEQWHKDRVKQSAAAQRRPQQDGGW